MSFIADAIAKVLEMAPPIFKEVTDAFGRQATFSSKQVHEVKASATPCAVNVEVFTLGALRDLVQAKLEDAAFTGDTFLHVLNERTVELVNRKTDAYGRRICLVQATPVPFDAFRFGQWMSQEEFVIAFSSRFADSADKSKVLAIASSMTNEATSLSEDNGFAQKVTIKKGLRQMESLTIEPKVKLAPFRTFPEIPQPESEFVFRAKANGEGVPHLMLVEADGGAWKVDAIETIKQRLESFGLNIPIIA